MNEMRNRVAIEAKKKKKKKNINGFFLKLLKP
jgi:hypothetical protein